MTDKFLDDLHPGENSSRRHHLTESGNHRLRADLRSQPFHLNAAVAAESIYGG